MINAVDCMAITVEDPFEVVQTGSVTVADGFPYIEAIDTIHHIGRPGEGVQHDVIHQLEVLATGPVFVVVGVIRKPFQLGCCSN